MKHACGWCRYKNMLVTIEKNSEKSATTWIIDPTFLQGTIVLGNHRLEEELRRATAEGARYNEPHE
jgi:hypothetical protein